MTKREQQPERLEVAPDGWRFVQPDTHIDLMMTEGAWFNENGVEFVDPEWSWCNDAHVYANFIDAKASFRMMEQNLRAAISDTAWTEGTKEILCGTALITYEDGDGTGYSMTDELKIFLNRRLATSLLEFIRQHNVRP